MGILVREYKPNKMTAEKTIRVVIGLLTADLYMLILLSGVIRVYAKIVYSLRRGVGPAGGERFI